VGRPGRGEGAHGGRVVAEPHPLEPAQELVVDDDDLLLVLPGQVENRRFGRLSGLRARAKALYKTDLLWETQRALGRPRARTVMS
jgi:hypothetical protein